ncbi:hypothetical protein [Pedobacter foliorum]|uniref:hypothetical protein n=2 Tax=Pedobacter foliorum TaxID=2739058 RepID=UPI001FE63816|nr:hypothetical protein [Pedobacter foliorum]
MTKLLLNMKPTFLKIAASTLLIAGFYMTAQAQKLKDVQEVSVTAPENIKIDGRNTEWNDTFQAENKRTGIFYTMSNDDKNLYLVIKSTDLTTNAKILAGGITLAINTEGKKKEKESITLTYPLISRPAQGGGQGGRRQMGIIMNNGGRGSQTPEQRDSAMAVMQKRQLGQVKEIKISGFKKTTDTLISVYNDLGIKAFSSIGNDKAFFYELAIPFEELGISKDAPKEFAYNVKLNGLQLQGLDGGEGGRGGFGGNRGGGGGNFGSRGSGIDYQALTSPTDFWGKYTIK